MENWQFIEKFCHKISLSKPTALVLPLPFLFDLVELVLHQLAGILADVEFVDNLKLGLEIVLVLQLATIRHSLLTLFTLTASTE